ncbi:carboxynorspermidine decarboxylase [Campylobacter canadensis]|uniref:Carboxynorspermidine/carboxyspermidine decarboxylase n=1 Tax=Campylobacter canadensis TaxID=449520 RepID=A0ABS7WPF3_9BACT|nr:carboxynorspermidine decarboxylase [Campylobacter canadensis]MBZ7986648.1 carboxynorspermidine decarboxylase [Campylobacter canadensis]MBZ7993947.1 carboxynorspermidine decarboxylase [Campylobacter canadensis]MBZ7996263.1 carboxynorspermidine decarboxylase [Campylobacter canadensis]MBZ7997684.1 carboxynorspermidine decarboxylase [Campylobacter canadensis]MBZ7999280.1 carboxynorspermidine decarboxylase [Campylobacter canadensis]
MYYNLKTPYYICYENKLKKNLELLKYIKDESGVKILLALKGFAFTQALDLVAKYLDGATASGLWEAKLSKEFINKQTHTYAPAFSEDDLEEIVKISEHLVVNSINEFKKVQKYKPKSLAIRCNLEHSFAPTQAYNPCAKFSRLGIRAKDLLNSDIKPNGLHFHALCEESFESLEKTFLVFEENFLKPMLEKCNLEYINLGGGHHITKQGYNVNGLINFIKNIKAKYNLDVYLEPGEAIGWECGDLVASVLDIVDNEKKIAILDVSAEAHMPDTILMPYTSKVENATILASKDEIFNVKSTDTSYILAANTCLAGDVMGEYKFNKKLQINDKIIFKDQIHYTIVKNNTFNGVKLPSLVFAKENGELLVKEFDYFDYSRRN